MDFSRLQGAGLFVTFQHVIQVVLSVYALRHSYVAIINLRKYEEATKKAAEWSNEAQRQLTKTRTTQGSGAATVVVNLATAITLMVTPIVAPNALPTWFTVGVCPTMLALTLGARQYLKNFWAPGAKDSKGKDMGTRIPLPKMGDYNTAVQKTEDLLKCLEYLEYTWAIQTFLALLPRDKAA